jgi:hypothetical protein
LDGLNAVLGQRRAREGYLKGNPMPDYTDAAIRSLIRAAGWRTMRALPVWVSLLVIVAALVFGHR